MSRDVDLREPLEGDDAQYVRDRPWLITDALLQGITVEFADGEFIEPATDHTIPTPDKSEDEGEEEGEVEDYTDAFWTKRELLAEIASRNEAREEDDHIVSESEKNADLIAALLADDAKAEEEDDESEDEAGE